MEKIMLMGSIHVNSTTGSHFTTSDFLHRCRHMLQEDQWLSDLVSLQIVRLKHTREWLIFSTVAKLVNGHSDNRVCLKVDIQVANPIPDTWQFLEITFKVMSQQVYVWDTSTHLLLPPPIQQLSSGWSHLNPSVSGYNEGSCCRHVITAIYLPVSS